MAVVGELVVAGKGDQTSKGGTEGKEDLSCGCVPYTDVPQSFQLLWGWVDIEQDSIVGSIKGDATDKENNEDEVGEEGCEVDDLAAGLDALDEAEADDDPGDGKAENELPTEATNILPGGVLLQPKHCSLEVVLAGRYTRIYLRTVNI